MKRWMFAAAALTMAAGTTACMSTGTSGTRTSHVRPSLYGHDNVDYEKVVSVNRWAHDRGYGVEWVNFPTRSVAKETPN